MPDTFAVLGVDPAMSRPCGVAVVLFRAGQPSVKFTRRMTAEGRDAIERVSWIGQQVADLCARLGLWGIPIGVGYEASWVGENVQTARKLGLVGGAVITAATLNGLAVREVQPKNAKRALTGAGNATKEDMIIAARQQFGLDAISEHEADAIGVALETYAQLQQIAREQQAAPVARKGARRGA